MINQPENNFPNIYTYVIVFIPIQSRHFMKLKPDFTAGEHEFGVGTKQIQIGWSDGGKTIIPPVNMFMVQFTHGE